MEGYYIYVKQSPAGMLYLGRTSSTNPERYLGSGKYWMNHITANNYKASDIKTWILDKVDTHNQLRELGRYYSKLFNVSKSDKWANLKDEEGEGFGTGDNHPFRINPELNPCIGRAGSLHPMYGKKGEDNPSYGQKRPSMSIKMTGNKHGKNNAGKSRPDLTERNKTNNPTSDPKIAEKIASSSGIRLKDHYCQSCGVHMNKQNYYRWGHDRH